MPETAIETKCVYCEKTFVRTLCEHKRSLRLGRPEFCSKSCACSFGNKTNPRPGAIQNIGEKAVRKKDQFTPFRWFLNRARLRSKDRVFYGRGCRKGKGPTDLTLEYLKKIWEDQNGICSLSGWQLILPDNTAIGWSGGPNPRNASLDRIDNSKGYVIGNVRYVAIMANYCRNGFSDDDVFMFCRAVTAKQHSFVS